MSEDRVVPRLWAITGATGTGKSELSLTLAQCLSESGQTAEVINADAMQLYRGMNIGTAKLPETGRRGVTHHLFDLLSPREEATVARYQPEARRVITETLHRGHHAILVGGSGLYVSSVIYDFRFPPRDMKLRADLEAQLAEQGAQALLARLHTLAPEAAQLVDARNPRRIVRALEVAMLGADASVTLPQTPTLWRDDTTIVHVREERSELVSRLDRRVERMWSDGLLTEVRELLPEGIAEGPTASRAIGYAQALAQIAGDVTQADAIASTQQLTRRYARRQVSWFKRYPEAVTVQSSKVANEQEITQLLHIPSPHRP